jgi:hypothetical protein
MRESKKKKKKKDGYDDILGLSYDKDMGKSTSYVTTNFMLKTKFIVLHIVSCCIFIILYVALFFFFIYYP